MPAKELSVAATVRFFHTIYYTAPARSQPLLGPLPKGLNTLTYDSFFAILSR